MAQFAARPLPRPLPRYVFSSCEPLLAVRLRGSHRFAELELFCASSAVTSRVSGDRPGVGSAPPHCGVPDQCLLAIGEGSSTHTRGMRNCCENPAEGSLGVRTSREPPDHPGNAAPGQSRAARASFRRTGLHHLIVAVLVLLVGFVLLLQAGERFVRVLVERSGTGIAGESQQGPSRPQRGRRLAEMVEGPLPRARHKWPSAEAGGSGQNAKEDRGPLLDSEDRELFAQALATKPAGSTPRIAFLFLARGPLPLARVWAKFFAGHGDLFSVYIHTEPGYQFRDQDIPEVFRGRQIRSMVSKPKAPCGLTLEAWPC